MLFFNLIYLMYTICIADTIQERLKVSIYYEGLCPASHEFIMNQLYPGYQKLQDNLLLDLVPLGHSWHSITPDCKEIQWMCQHGPLECYINKINACAINLNSTQSDLMEFVTCVLECSFISSGQDIEKEIAIECAEGSRLSWHKINTCLTTELANKLELDYEPRQNKLVPKLLYVPHIRFNDTYNKETEDEAIDDFLGTVCKLFKVKPGACENVFLKMKMPQSKKKTKCYLNDIVRINNFLY